MSIPAISSRVNRRFILLGAAVGAASVVPAFGQSALAPYQFRSMELMGGEYAMQTSQLAFERSSNAHVRNFAQLEINEQTAIAAALGATPGSAPLRPDQAALLQRLNTMRSPAFDRAYVVGQIAGHQELLDLNSSYSQTGFAPLCRSVAIVAVPTIQTHLSILSGLRRVA